MKTRILSIVALLCLTFVAVEAWAQEQGGANTVPEGAINGKFTVSAGGDQVYFSQGNLKYDGSTWSFFDNQYDYLATHDGTNWDKFGWSTSATTYGMSTSDSNRNYFGDFVDWGATMGDGWRTLTSDEWTYLFNTRTASTVGGTENARYAKAKVNDLQGVILFPDTYTHPGGVTAPTGINATGDAGWNGNNYDATAWAKMESAGCVFLPAVGRRDGSSVSRAGSYGYYWSGTASGSDYAWYVNFYSSNLYPAYNSSRYFGCSVRLVRAAEADVALKRITLTIPAKSYMARIDADKRQIENAVAGVSLYSVKNVTNTEVELTGELSVIAAEMPYFIYNDNDTEVEVSIIVSSSDPDNVDYDSEHFKGTLVDKTFTDEDMEEADHYVLSGGSSFVWVKDAGVLSAGKCWIELIPSSVAHARRLSIVHEGETTGISTVKTTVDTKDAAVYDLQGRRVMQPTKGLFIVNGKKVVIK